MRAFGQTHLRTVCVIWFGHDLRKCGSPHFRSGTSSMRRKQAKLRCRPPYGVWYLKQGWMRWKYVARLVHSVTCVDIALLDRRGAEMNIAPWWCRHRLGLWHLKNPQHAHRGRPVDLHRACGLGLVPSVGQNLVVCRECNRSARRFHAKTLHPLT